jgi:hypothetical protein
MQEGRETEHYEVEIERDVKTKVAVRESWRQGRKSHRIDGPAHVRRDPGTGVAILEVWRQNDQCHRVDGPAVIRRKADTGRIYWSEWFEGGAKVSPQRPPEKKRVSGPSKAPE